MQHNFFDDNTQQNSAPAPTTGQPAAKRLFLYDGQLFEDPGPEYSVRDVLGFLSETYPELSNGSWTARTLPDGSEEITFVKVTGEKGASITVAHGYVEHDRTLAAGQVADALLEGYQDQAVAGHPLLYLWRTPGALYAIPDPHTKRLLGLHAIVAGDFQPGTGPPVELAKGVTLHLVERELAVEVPELPPIESQQ